jgi:hypothetical protein
VLAVEPVHESLISSPQKLRAPVAPALVEQVSRPLVSIRTLRGSYFSSPRIGPREGHTYLVRDRAILMPTNVVVVVRCGRAFSGDTAARVVGDVGKRT